MHELRIGDISRLTNRTSEHIRRFERAGRIPKAHQDEYGGWRYWDEADLPAICAGLGVPLPPTLEDRVMSDINDVAAKLGIDLNLDDPLAIFQELAPVISGSRESDRWTGYRRGNA